MLAHHILLGTLKKFHTNVYHLWTPQVENVAFLIYISSDPLQSSYGSFCHMFLLSQRMRSSLMFLGRTNIIKPDKTLKMTINIKET